MFKAFCIMVILLASTVAQGENRYEKVNKTTHVLEEETILDARKCSSTAIGPHALLTASHCEAPTDVITIDGDPASVQKIYRDGLDHSIYVVDATFTDYARISTKQAKVGDDVFIFGEPGMLSDVLRKGYIAKETDTEFIYDLNGFYGDSGSAVFNKDGEIVGVLTAMQTVKTDDPTDLSTLKVCLGFALNFKPEVLQNLTNAQ